MNKPLLSVIVPVYNVEKYLRECYASIYDEDEIEKLEIILIDDGATDSSGAICDELSKNKNTITVHKQNGGLATARNEGLKHAKGKYVTFIDPDDKINPKTCKVLLNYIAKNDTDLIYLNITKFYKDGTTEDIGDNIDNNMIAGRSKNECIEYLSCRPKFPASACGKAYLRKFLTDYKISFPNDDRISEDMDFSFKCILEAKTFYKIDGPFYYYRQNRDGSITNKTTIKSFDGLSQFIVDSINLYAANDTPKDDNIKKMFNYLAYEYTILLWQYNFIAKSHKKRAFSFLKKYRYVMKWSSTRNNKIIKILVALLGVKATSKALLIAKRNK
ncbi:glycosyltransferase family 2 protein [Candidatus Saccharibacteria bacterium]|nr:glycosyltransferase family 2 protein [Candidatus Saccharibacteria bacterium]